jgi:hypothetical protein
MSGARRTRGISLPGLKGSADRTASAAPGALTNTGAGDTFTINVRVLLCSLLRS